jgi:hypothetical protein
VNVTGDAEAPRIGNYALAVEQYSAAGWLGVLPLPPRSKMPPPKRFTGAGALWPSAADRADWSLNTDPECNVALRLPDTVVGLDIDQYGDKRGAEALMAVAAEHGLSPLPLTWRSSARDGPSGIYLFRVPAGTKLRGEAAPGVETIQHHHRFAVVWPSWHPTLDVLYRWWTPEGIVSLRVPRLDELPELPADWLDYLVDTTPEALAAEHAVAVPRLEPPEEWHTLVYRAYDSAVAALRGAQTGSRHDAARNGAMSLCRHESNGLAGSTAALGLLGEVFVSVVEHERPEGAAVHEWGRILRGGRALAQRTTTQAALYEQEEREGFAFLMSAVPEAATELVERTDTGTPDTAAQPTLVDPCGDALIDWGVFWTRERAESEYLVEPLLARGRSHAMFAGAKSGKSLLMLEVAAACATGRRVLDEGAREPLDVVYCDMEMTEDDLHERLEDLGYGPDDDLSRLHYYLLPALPALDTEAGGVVVEEIVRQRGPELVVFDTTSRVIAGNENDADTFRAFYRHTGMRLKRLGVTYARLDHSGKDPDKGQRGSSAKADDVDVVWKLDPTADGVRLKATHRRIAWIPEALTLRRQSDPLRHVQVLGSWPEGTNEAARLIDGLGLPLDVAVRTAMAALRDAGHGRRTTVVTAALKYRRQQAERLEGLIT